MIIQFPKFKTANQMTINNKQSSHLEKRKIIKRIHTLIKDLTHPERIQLKYKKN